MKRNEGRCSDAPFSNAIANESQGLNLRAPLSFQLCFQANWG